MDFERLQDEVFRHYRRGEFDEALALISPVRSGWPEHEARFAFWSACLEAKRGELDLALTCLETAIAAGHWYGASTLADEDLETLHDDRRFRAVVRECAERRERYIAARQHPLAVSSTAGGWHRALLAFHRAAGSPPRELPRWKAALRSGWGLVLPWGGHVVDSDSHHWLTADRLGIDFADAQRAGRDALRTVAGRSDGAAPPLVAAGFSQGAAVALALTLDRTLPASGVVTVGATLRFAEVVRYLKDRSLPSVRIAMIVGEHDRHLGAAQDLRADLATAGVEVRLEVRPDLGHAFPDSFAEELPELLEWAVS